MKEKRVDLLIGYGGGKEAERIRRQRSLGFKITASVDIFFVGEGSAAFTPLHAAGIRHNRAQQVGQTPSRFEALAGMEIWGKGRG